MLAVVMSMIVFVGTTRLRCRVPVRTLAVVVDALMVVVGMPVIGRRTGCATQLTLDGTDDGREKNLRNDDRLDHIVQTSNGEWGGTGLEPDDPQLVGPRRPFAPVRVPARFGRNQTAVIQGVGQSTERLSERE
jgi:hypothetical protein